MLEGAAGGEGKHVQTRPLWASQRPAPRSALVPVVPSRSRRWPSEDLCQRALSLPRTNASTRLIPQETAPESEASTPPSLSHPLRTPFHHLCQSPLSDPRKKMSRRPEDQEDTSGPEVSTSPRDSQLHQEVPSHTGDGLGRINPAAAWRICVERGLKPQIQAPGLDRESARSGCRSGHSAEDGGARLGINHGRLRPSGSGRALDITNRDRHQLSTALSDSRWVQ